MEKSSERALELHRLGCQHESQGDSDGARRLYEEAWQLDLTCVPVMRDLGRLYLRIGDLDRAQKSFRALLLQRLDASAGITKADAYCHLGEVHQRQGDSAKAIAMLQRALDADANHAAARELMKRLRP